MLHHVALQRAHFSSRTNLPGTSGSAVCAFQLWRGQPNCRAISCLGRHRWQVCLRRMFIWHFFSLYNHVTGNTSIRLRKIVLDVLFSKLVSRRCSVFSLLLLLMFMTSVLCLFHFSSHSFHDFPSLFLNQGILKWPRTISRFATLCVMDYGVECPKASSACCVICK